MPSADDKYVTLLRTQYNLLRAHNDAVEQQVKDLQAEIVVLVDRVIDLQQERDSWVKLMEAHLDDTHGW